LEQLAVARDAARVFGKSRHRAALNYGDCFSYAAAVALGQPLFFVGDDFPHTDIVRVDW
jgi:ribonuclease VapC